MALPVLTTQNINTVISELVRSDSHIINIINELNAVFNAVQADVTLKNAVQSINVRRAVESLSKMGLEKAEAFGTLATVLKTFGAAVEPLAIFHSLETFSRALINKSGNDLLEDMNAVRGLRALYPNIAPELVGTIGANAVGKSVWALSKTVVNEKLGDTNMALAANTMAEIIKKFGTNIDAASVSDALEVFSHALVEPSTNDVLQDSHAIKGIRAIVGTLSPEFLLYIDAQEVGNAVWALSKAVVNEKLGDTNMALAANGVATILQKFGTHIDAASVSNALEVFSHALVEPSTNDALQNSHAVKGIRAILHTLSPELLMHVDAQEVGNITWALSKAIVNEKFADSSLAITVMTETLKKFGTHIDVASVSNALEVFTHALVEPSTNDKIQDGNAIRAIQALHSSLSKELLTHIDAQEVGNAVWALSKAAVNEKLTDNKLAISVMGTTLKAFGTNIDIQGVSAALEVLNHALVEPSTNDQLQDMNAVNGIRSLYTNLSPELFPHIDAQEVGNAVWALSKTVVNEKLGDANMALAANTMAVLIQKLGTNIDMDGVSAALEVFSHALIEPSTNDALQDSHAVKGIRAILYSLPQELLHHVNEFEAGKMIYALAKEIVDESAGASSTLATTAMAETLKMLGNDVNIDGVYSALKLFSHELETPSANDMNALKGIHAVMLSLQPDMAAQIDEHLGQHLTESLIGTLHMGHLDRVQVTVVLEKVMKVFDQVGIDDNDVIKGTSAADQISSVNGHDYIDGGAGDDTIYAYGGNDVLVGGAGSDRLWGDHGNDVIFGDAGNDFLYGGEGDDYMNGGAGNDLLQGMRGSEVMIGGDGNDRFVFVPAVDDDGISIDRVLDFQINGTSKDVLDLSYALANYDPLQDSINDFLKVTQNNGKLEIGIDQNGQGQFQQIMVLENITQDYTAEQLVKNGNIIV